MQIDLFTFLAQIANFIVLVVLLRIFLYTPIIQAMDKREERISSRLEEGRRKLEEAEEQKKRYEDERQELEEKKDSYLEKAREDAEERKRTLLDDAREEVATREKRWRESLEEKKSDFLSDFRNLTIRQFTDSMRNMLDDLANQDLEQQTAMTFAGRIESMSDDTFSTFDGFLVESPFELGNEIRGQLERVLREKKDYSVEVEFRTNGEMSFGIMVTGGDHRIAWTVDEYLESIERRIKGRIEQEIRGEGEHE